MKKIFPKEILENTSLVHQFKHRKRSSIIYSTFLLAIIIAFCALPFIKIDIYATSRGLIRSEKERVKITVVNLGKVLENNIRANKEITKGDTLLVLDAYAIHIKMDLLASNIKEYSNFTHDLRYLLRGNQISISSIRSPKYQQEYGQYQKKLQELQTRFKKQTRDLTRNKTLFEKGVIAAVTFENYQYEYDLTVDAIALLKKQQYTTWQGNLTIFNRQLKEFDNNLQQQNDHKSYYVLTAPISGTLINVIGIEKGSYLNAGQPIAEISPNGTLVAECYVLPLDIGLINPENQVKFQIDAFNYNQWGLATGSIIEIAKDIEILNEAPVFKITCKLDQKYLTLKNNYKGNLKKGMTFSARFKLAERSLFELLYDKIDDWLNPNGVNEIE
ncbi:MAG: HlyD family efflux transporter periplasmic adaptor subunit [Flavobacteriaceae bacterium]|nr:HlyD family efflux transporter periplasmic adaptor subunit [Flavobacteriaceae bacterium]